MLLWADRETLTADVRMLAVSEVEPLEPLEGQRERFEVNALTGQTPVNGLRDPVAGVAGGGLYFR